eukprot:6472838-Amphidinium_carterae.2
MEEQIQLKLTPDMVLCGQFDGRTITGLKRNVDRLQGLTKPTPQAGLLKNYHTLICHAQTLSAPSLVNVPDKEYNEAIMAIESENIVLPLPVKSNIVARHCQQARTAKKYQLLFDMVNPFEVKPWSSSDPCLGGIGCPSEEKFLTFETVCFE